MKKYLIFIILLLNVSLSSAQGFSLGVNASYGNTTIYNPSLEWANRDTIQYFTWAPQIGISGTYIFKKLEYYHKVLYGIRFNVNYSTHAQERENFFADSESGLRVGNRQRTVLRYLDVPLMFNFSRSHNQGLYLEVGPQFSILLSAKNRLLSGAGTIENLNKSDFVRHTFSGIIGIGTFYNLSEKIAFHAGFRGGYTFQDIAKNKSSGMENDPTRRFWLGINASFYYKINKYAAKRNRGLDRYSR